MRCCVFARYLEGCVCSDTWTYNGASYQGCSSVNWPVPWCATAPGCGVCDTQSVSTGCWDDCEPTGKDAALEKELMRRATSWCEPSSLPTCGVEALRSLVDGNNMCGTTCTKAELDKYRWAIDGPNATSMAAANGYALTSTTGSLKGTVYDAESGSCDCTNMLPSCACEARTAAPPPPVPHPGSDPTNAIIGAVASFISFVVLVLIVYFVWRRYRKKGPDYAPPGMQMQPVVAQQPVPPSAVPQMGGQPYGNPYAQSPPPYGAQPPPPPPPYYPSVT